MTVNLYHQIMDYGREKLGWLENKYTAEKQPSFIKKWEKGNRRFPLNKLNSHADYYRFKWDRKKFLYYLRQPEKAPIEEDWINESNDYAPLRMLAYLSEIALLH